MKFGPSWKEKSMPLINFGSIFNFAEQLEKSALNFYQDALKNDGCSEYSEMFEQTVKDVKKNAKLVIRARQENVTEMILETINDFTRAPYSVEIESPETMDKGAVLENAKKLEENAIQYYQKAAEKLISLPEAARVLKTLGKKRASRKEKLGSL